MLPMACGSLKDKFIVYSLIFGGLRVSGLKHLRRSWVNLEKGLSLFRQGDIVIVLSALKSETEFGDRRLKKGARTVLIHPVLLPVMREFLASDEELGLSRVSIWQRVKKLARQAHIVWNIYRHCI